MEKHSQGHLAVALDAFGKNVRRLMADQGISSDTELWRMVTKRSKSELAQKTVNNIVQGRHDGKVSTMEAVAEALNVPLWLLLIPELSDNDLKSPRKERFIAFVRDYLAINDENKGHLENMAAAYLAKEKQ